MSHTQYLVKIALENQYIDLEKIKTFKSYDELKKYLRKTIKENILVHPEHQDLFYVAFGNI